MDNGHALAHPLKFQQNVFQQNVLQQNGFCFSKTCLSKVCLSKIVAVSEIEGFRDARLNPTRRCKEAGFFVYQSMTSPVSAKRVVLQQSKMCCSKTCSSKTSFSNILTVFKLASSFPVIDRTACALIDYVHRHV
jgi:hypothetical protein